MRRLTASDDVIGIPEFGVVTLETTPQVNHHTYKLTGIYHIAVKSNTFIECGLQVRQAEQPAN